MTNESKKKNIQKGIQNAFIHRDCFTLVRPVVDEEALQTLDKTPWESLRDKFKSGMEELIKKVTREATTKKVFGKPLNGPG